jgi:hypothetical protein
MAVPPLVALKATGSAQKALTGDLYVKRWQTVKKRSKAQGGNVAVDHELHINPVGIAIAGAAATAAAAILGLGAYMMGARLKVNSGEGAKTVKRIVDIYPPGTDANCTIIDTPAWTETIEHEGSSHQEHDIAYTGEHRDVWIPETNIKGIIKPGYWAEIPITTELETTHTVWDLMPWTETRSHGAITHDETRVLGRTVVMTNRFRPTGTYTNKEDAFAKMTARYTNPSEVTVDKEVSVVVRNTRIRRLYCHFTADGFSAGIEGMKPRGSLIDVM